MKQFFFTSLFIAVGSISFAQYVIPEKKVTPKKITVKKKEPSKTVNAESYIIIFRGSQFAASLSNYNIFIDGRQVCKLSNGRYLKYPVSPGKHEIEAKKSGVDIGKKETFASVITKAGKNNYVACNIKTGLLKEKLEMMEVVESAGKQSVNDLKVDNCQGDIQEKKGKN
ncbi:DUF2846 domain-containing protein [Ferruginibacter sp. SUN106]|uniref:DUF2846 domain-containing protein n=1 Tax=Ferruginibacter sp. SUN106 TaxID=2978348 RepID=UPI003D36DF05